MGEPIRAALEKAACAMCICEGECFETRHGMMNGPCEKQIEKVTAVVNAFIWALPPLLTWQIGAHHLKQVARIEELEEKLEAAARILHKAGEQFTADGKQDWAQRCFNAHDAALGTSSEQR